MLMMYGAGYAKGRKRAGILTVVFSGAGLG